MNARLYIDRKAKNALNKPRNAIAGDMQHNPREPTIPRIPDIGNLPWH